MNFSSMLITAAAGFLLTAGSLQAQCRMPDNGNQGYGMPPGDGSGVPSVPPEGSSGMLTPWEFDTSTMDTLTGTVDTLDTLTMNGTNKLITVYLDAGLEDSIQVVLAPPEFLKEAGFFFSHGDLIQVIGSRVEYDGYPVILASQIRQGRNILLLRDENGSPLWQEMPRQAPGLQ